MVQYRAFTKTLSVDEMAALFNRTKDEFREQVLISMAEVIAQTSPVDTGTYAKGHEVALRSGSHEPTETSHDKPRKQPAGPARDEGLNKMKAGIAAVNRSSDNVVFRNNAIHAVYVEREHRVYAKARREINTIVQETAARLGVKTR